MRQRWVLSVILSSCLLLMASAVSASSHSPVHTNIPVVFPVLQLGAPLRFLNHNGLPLHIPSRTYQVTALSPDMLRLTSTPTEKAQNLHTRPITHTESLTAPYPFLIKEAGEQRHVHLFLLLPDGQGLDAEGRWEQTQSRGVGYMNRSIFTSTRRYTEVIMQQGRVTTNTDFNEQEPVSSSARTGLLSEVAPSYGWMELEQGRIQLDTEARESLHRRCRFCAKKQ